jgi:hypothetical protein
MNLLLALTLISSYILTSLLKQKQVCSLDLEHANLVMRKLPALVDAPVIMNIAWNIPLKHKYV